MSSTPWNTKIPETLNGYPVVAYIEHENCATVMMDRSEGELTDLIVATWWPELGDRWQWGHYDFRSYKEAEENMMAAWRDYRYGMDKPRPTRTTE